MLGLELKNVQVKEVKVTPESVAELFTKTCKENRQEIVKYLGEGTKMIVGKKSLVIFNNNSYWKMVVKGCDFKILYAKPNEVDWDNNKLDNFKRLQWVELKTFKLKLNHYSFSVVRNLQDFILMILPHEDYHHLKRAR